MKLVACLNFDRPPCTKSRLISTDPADVTEISGRHGRVEDMDEWKKKNDKTTRENVELMVEKEFE